MSRVAWEAHTFAYGLPARDLQARRVASLLDKELGIEDPAKLESIEVGLLLVMQIDPTGASKTILFGHQSFREFLVARYWKYQLLRLVAHETKRDQRSKIEEGLMQARLVQDEDEAFSLLIEMLRSLDTATRHDIREWAQEYVQVDELTLHPDVQADRRPVLRESALAIGSDIEPEVGLELDEWALRFLCFWQQFHGQVTPIRAPGLRSPHSFLWKLHLMAAHFRGAHFEGANFREANLTGANLARANLARANLVRAALIRANLAGANLVEANLLGAVLDQVNLAGAQLAGANLTGANLVGAVLTGATLQGAVLERANLERANLEGANLIGVNLRKVRLGEANLRGARVSRKQLELAYLRDALGLDEIDEILDPA
jgi:hypothetical protein